jgi:hypothetical protein
MSCFNVLRGERINGMLLGNDGWTLVFRTVEGRYFRFDTSNDCCNTVWFNHVNGVDVVGKGNSFDLLRGVMVLSVEEKDFERQEDESAYEVVDDAFVTILTDRGYIDIEVRNSHNGYYGGTIFYNEETDLNRIEDLKEVFDDF